MPKYLLRGFGVVIGVLFLCGCAATKNVEMRHYIEVKDRVDQNMEGGNAGFVGGTPQPVDRSDIRMTRKTYVLEVSKNPGEETDETLIQDEAAMEETRYEPYEQPVNRDEDMGYEDYPGNSVDRSRRTPDFDDIDVVNDTVKAPSSFVAYTVQKDDTLQKISKKFYDSYSKWSRIYEANKDVIDDPDRIKPGIELQIPMN